MWDETTNKAAVVGSGRDIDKISEALKQRNLTLEKVFVTHGHLDIAVEPENWQTCITCRSKDRTRKMHGCWNS